MTGFDLCAALDRLDRDLAGAAAAARGLLLRKSPASKRAGSRALLASLEEVERGLLFRYGRDFADPNWHGPSSFQRIVWQDAEMLEFLAETAAFDALLQRRDSGIETPIAPGLTLSGAILGGLARNRPSYLASVCPNWRLRPPFVTLERLDDMAVGPNAQHEPFLVTETQLEATRRAGLGAIASSWTTGSPDGGDPDGDFYTAIGTTPCWKQVEALSRLCTRTVAARLMNGSNNPSVSLHRMNGQCLEVMSHFEDLLRAYDGDHVRVLGLGLVSHALDAKHLIAVIAEGLGEGETRYRKVTDDGAISAVRALLADTARDRLGGEAGALMRARLQQCLQLLWRDRTSLGHSEAALWSALEG